MAALKHFAPLSQIGRERASRHVAAPADSAPRPCSGQAVGARFNEARSGNEAEIDLETVFCAEYRRIAHVIARVTRDPARAEELAVDVFLKWERTPKAHGAHAAGWLYRTAVRAGLKELRSETRRAWYERLFALVPSGRTNGSRTPEDVHTSREEQRQVRVVLSALSWRQAALLLLRSEGLSYAEVAAAVQVNPGSVGTLLARAQRTFRKEFVKRYGDA